MSPDLNPIENLWRRLKDQVECLNPEKMDDFVEKINFSWECIDISLMESLVNSMTARLQKVIQSGGEKINY